MKYLILIALIATPAFAADDEYTNDSPPQRIVTRDEAAREESPGSLRDGRDHCWYSSGSGGYSVFWKKFKEGSDEADMDFYTNSPISSEKQALRIVEDCNRSLTRN